MFHSLGPVLVVSLGLVVAARDHEVARSAEGTNQQLPHGFQAPFWKGVKFRQSVDLFAIDH